MDIRKKLNEFGLERSKMQREFHESFLQSVCLHLYKDDPDVDMEKIMRINNWDDLRQSVLCMTPRRFGKTTAVSMFVAAYAMCVPNSVQSIFSTGRRASQKLLELIRDMVKKTPWADRIIKCNQEEFVLQGDSPFDKRKVFSYPSCAKTLRGVGGDVLYLEEAAFLDLQVFFEIVVPLLEMATTALIAISTPQDKLNFYSEMFELRDNTGELFFRTIRVSLVCAKCQAAGKGADCTHKQDMIPPWKSVAKLDMVRALYADQGDLMQRESMGAITDDAKSLFESNLVTTFLKEKSFVLTSKPDYIFMAMDPNGGGTSHMAIVSVVFDSENVVVVGVDTAPTDKHDQIEQMLKQHVRSLRGKPMFKESHIIFIPENNLGQEAEHARHMLRNEKRLYTIHEKRKAGVCTTHARKEIYALTLLTYFNSGTIRFLEDAVCANPMMDANTRLVQTKKEFEKQLVQFRKIILPGTQPFKDAKFIFTGKAKRGMNDDLVMTLMIAIFWGREFVRKRIAGVPYGTFT
tara:strand:- start:15964 stop:17517 length:1554 start_codon:yes stop_codon:yes gene_type:complete